MWPKYWCFSFSISPSDEYSGLTSFRIDRFDHLAVQGTLKSVLQHHSSTASILWCSAFFAVQLSHIYMTTGKTIALTIWIFVGTVMSLLFNVPSRVCHSSSSKEQASFNFLPPITVHFGVHEYKMLLFPLFLPSICHEAIGPDAMILVL